MCAILAGKFMKEDFGACCVRVDGKIGNKTVVEIMFVSHACGQWPTWQLRFLKLKVN